MDLTIRTRDRSREARCRACRAAEDGSMEEWPAAAAHTCRRPPAAPAATVQDRLRRHEEIRTERELRIRRETLADRNA